MKIPKVIVILNNKKKRNYKRTLKPKLQTIRGKVNTVKWENKKNTQMCPCSQQYAREWKAKYS